MGNPYDQFDIANPYDQFDTDVSAEDSINVNRSPIELEPARTQTFGSQDDAAWQVGGAIPPFETTVDKYTTYEREAASRGVDIHSELKDQSLRSALGFSPNQDFSADYLAKELSKKTGLPAEQMVQIAPNGSLEFYNPETKRFTPVDSSNFTQQDLRDAYGPTTAIGPPVALSIVGMVGGPTMSIASGSLGAFVGEISRLQYGKEIGVHNLSNEDILEEGIKALALDASFGVGGQAIGELRRLGRKLLKPEGFTREEAQNILDNLGKHQDDVTRINELLEAAGSKHKFTLDPVADAEDVLGLEMREAAARTSQQSKSIRATELKANDSALKDLARVLNQIDASVDDILTKQGAGDAARPAQASLRAERNRIQDAADKKLSQVEDEAKEALDELGTLRRSEAREELENIVNTYSKSLETEQGISWRGYQENIGQKVPGDEGFAEATRYVSDVQIPITPEIAEAHKALRLALKESLLKRKAQGSKVVKGTKPTTKVTTDSPILGLDGKPISSETVTKTNTIDLAVLDDDIKEIRDVLRRGDPGFSTRKMRMAEKQLKKLRNEYLRDNRPETLALLEKAEKNTTVFHNFVDESVFARILKRGPDGSYAVDNVDAFKIIFRDTSGDMMGALTDIAKTQPGAMATLQATALKLYKATVIPEGATIMNRAKHDAFIAKYEEVLEPLFGDPRLIRFGTLENRVAKALKHAEKVRTVLQKSPLAKFGDIAPERMGKAVFSEGISEKNIKQTLLHLDAAGKEMGESFRDSVGRDVFKRITPDGNLSTSAISKLITEHGGKLQQVFGAQYVKDLVTLRRLIKANAQTVSGKEFPSQTLIGRFARAIVTPPLTKRGRLQTWLEALRRQTANDVINQAVRDPEILRAIVINANRDIKTSAVLNILGQTSGSALALED